MKKLFLIPLLTLVCSVMAFADNVAKIGTVEYETLQAALDAADANATITLLSDAAGDITISKNITFAGDKKITGNITIGASEVTLTLAGVTIDVTNNDAIVHLGKTLNVVVADGTTNAINAKSKGCDCFYGINNGSLNISGNGTLNVYGYEAIHVSRLNLSAPNATYGASNTLMYDPQIVSATISAGTFDAEFPSNYVSAPLFIEKVSSSYQVSNIGANKAVYNYTAYATLQAAVDAAPAGATIVMYADDNSSVEVGKNLIIDTKGHSINGAVAASGYAKAIMGDKVAFSDNAIAAFLMADGTASLTVSEDANIASAGAIHVNGDKTLTINSDVTVTYKRQGSLANIVVDEGAKLTVLGSGTFQPVMHSETRTIDGFTAEISSSASNQIGNRVIDVDGELVVGAKNDAANCPHFITSSIARGSAVMVNATGVATFNNADMKVACMSIKNYGNVTINGGEYKSIATYQNGIDGGWYAYHLNNEGVMTVNDGHFVGVQGAFSNTTANAIVTINGGSFETVNGHNWATGEANAKDNHYALYVACYSVVNVYGGYYKVTTPSAGGGKVVLVGNNDAYNTYGIVNLYGGHFQRKVEVSPRKNADSSYPASIPSTSQWYGSFGSLAPLPAGYEYYETDDATYPWGVRAIAGKGADAIDPAQQAAQEADPTYTIPWQQATTWAADEVPVENTIVTIPVDATVTVSKDEEVKDAVADQVYVAQGATLKVEEGTTLTVGDGGMNIGNGGQIVVEAGATVKIGSAGIITTEEEALVIESNDDVQGVLLYEPSVEENTQPKATVKLTTKSRQIGANSYVFERFAIPTIDGELTSYSIEGGIPTSGLYNDAPSFLQAVWEWNNATDEWQQLSRFKDMQPFHGYQLTNNSAAGGLVYVFEGNLVGNQDKDYEFVENGFHFFGNSYSADINIKTFLNSLGADVEKTVWVYDPYDKTFKTITERMANGRVKYGNGEQIKDVRSMQAFLMYLSDGESGTAGVNYASAIWGNPKYNPAAAPAPARHEASNEDWVTIRVSASNGLKDEVILNQSEDFTAAFENGADANKFMNNENINLFAATNAGNLAVVATNDLNNTVLTFAAGNATEYTLQFADIEGYEFTLRDNVTGANVLMTEGATYTFEQEANTTVPARFEILGAAKMPTAIDNVEAAAKANGIYTVTGQFLGHDFTKLPAGVYVVNGVKIVK